MRLEKMLTEDKEALLKWCKRHDWGKEAVLYDDCIHNLYDSEKGTYTQFYDSAELEAWAGY